MKEFFDSFGLISLSEDPKNVIRELQDKARQLERMHGLVKSDSDIIDKVLANLPEEYENTVENLRNIERSSGTLEMKQVKDQLGAKYNRLKSLRRRKKSSKKKRRERDSSDSDSEE